MSAGFMLYSVPFGALFALVGSKDRRLLARMRGRFRGNHWGQGELSVEDAFEALVEGGPLDPAAGSQYAYAIKAYCEEVGHYLSNGNFSKVRSDYMESVDQALGRMGLGQLFSLFEFWRNELPLPQPLPSPLEAYPSYGAVPRERVVAIRDRLRRLHYLEGDHDVGEGIENLREWVEICARREQGLIAFYH